MLFQLLFLIELQLQLFLEFLLIFVDCFLALLFLFVKLNKLVVHLFDFLFLGCQNHLVVVLQLIVLKKSVTLVTNSVFCRIVQTNLLFAFRTPLAHCLSTALAMSDWVLVKKLYKVSFAKHAVLDIRLALILHSLQIKSFRKSLSSTKLLLTTNQAFYRIDFESCRSCP